MSLPPPCCASFVRRHVEIHHLPQYDLQNKSMKFFIFVESDHPFVSAWRSFAIGSSSCPFNAVPNWNSIENYKFSYTVASLADCATGQSGKSFLKINSAITLRFITLGRIHIKLKKTIINILCQLNFHNSKSAVMTPFSEKIIAMLFLFFPHIFHYEKKHYSVAFSKYFLQSSKCKTRK